jgi:hypothetical protein
MTEFWLAVLPTAGFVLGVVLGRWNRTPRLPKSVQPICGCRHHLSHHDPDSGVCNAQQVEWVGSSAKMMKCTCRQYVGPKPADSFFTEDVAWDSSVMQKLRDQGE